MPIINSDTVFDKLQKIIDCCVKDQKFNSLTALFKMADEIKCCPVIDSETLPIVQELRKVVARLVEARENANEACSKYEFKCKELEKQLEEARRDCAVAEKNHAECVEQLSKVTVERDTLLRERKCLEDAEPVKHAKWEWYPDRKDRQELLCTNCEFEAPYDYQGKYMFTKYCPYCGAKMDLKEKQNVHENPNN